MKLTPYGSREIGLSLVLTAIAGAGCLWLGQETWPGFSWVAAGPGLVMLWILYFFRDPERQGPSGQGLLLSPADGTVTHVDEVEEPSFISGRALRISIFMSIFSVHVNRAPCAGRVAHKAYRKGQFVNALSGDSSHLNEANDMGLETALERCPRILVRQIAGLIARRIVCDKSVGDDVAQGERYGMIKFSSRVEVFLPAESGLQLSVKAGDAVRGGLSVLGEFPS